MPVFSTQHTFKQEKGRTTMDRSKIGEAALDVMGALDSSPDDEVVGVVVAVALRTPAGELRVSSRMDPGCNYAALEAIYAALAEQAGADELRLSGGAS